MLLLKWNTGAEVVVDRRRLIGSDAACDVVVPGAAAVQAVVETAGAAALVEDVADSCDTAVNGSSIVGRRALVVGDRLTCGAGVAAVVRATVDLDGGPLTPRQFEVMAGYADGLSPQDVADELGVSVNTVNNHTRTAYQRLGVSKRADALRKMFRDGLLPDTRSSASDVSLLDFVQRHRDEPEMSSPEQGRQAPSATKLESVDAGQTDRTVDLTEKPEATRVVAPKVCPLCNERHVVVIGDDGPSCAKCEQEKVGSNAA